MRVRESQRAPPTMNNTNPRSYMRMNGARDNENLISRYKKKEQVMGASAREGKAGYKVLGY